MLKDNIKTARNSKGLSQEKLATKLNVVRQTISKWEQGLSVPDVEMLMSISKNLDVSVSTLIGENILEKKNDDINTIAQKLEVINLQLAQRKNKIRKLVHNLLILFCIIIFFIYLILFIFNGFYFKWNDSEFEYNVLSVALHSFEWLFVRVSHFILIGLIIGIILTRKKS